MRITTSYEYAANPKDVFAMMADPAFQAAKESFQSPYPWSRVICRSVPEYSTTSPRLLML